MLNQAVDVGFKTRALGIELAGKLQVVHDFPVEDFARNQQRNTRRVRCHQPHRDAPFKMVNLDPFRGAVSDVGIGVARLHGRGQFAQVHLGGQAGNVVLGVQGVNMLAQVSQTHLLVLGVLLAKLGQNAPHGLVFGVIVFELLQRS